VDEFAGAGAGNVTAFGAMVSGGGHLASETPFLRNLVLTADAGVLFGVVASDTVYDVGPVGNAYNYDLVGGPSVTDGRWQRERLNRDTDYFAVPVLLTLAYEFQVGDSFALRLGLTGGGTFVSIKNDFAATYDIYDEHYTRLAGHSGETYSKDASKFVLSGGGVVGATWSPSANFSVDLQYRFLKNSSLNFGTARNYGDSLSHNIALTARWSF